LLSPCNQDHLVPVAIGCRLSIRCQDSESWSDVGTSFVFFCFPSGREQSSNLAVGGPCHHFKITSFNRTWVSGAKLGLPVLPPIMWRSWLRINSGFNPMESEFSLRSDIRLILATAGDSGQVLVCSVYYTSRWDAPRSTGVVARICSGLLLLGI
jgi:hypothetical protein